ncbi:hypothetical protein DQ04_04011060 [Trypanosoma grayi]|uniref:hypothetical protein n=1 Tax=Trypanosoma grayi TaxID=71804 RepID=UPI0004F47052|nr:hypothetical protein DQ04_04011060 [Trypanosoma grayi]KEG10233.1 hypothetical protein DQ04_04011060 [Trypanosoma grayi]
MNASITTPVMEDAAVLPTEAQHFLQVIADMQREAEQRRRLLDELRQTEAKARSEQEKVYAARDASVARLAHTNAESLQLQVQLQDLCNQQKEAEATVLELRRQKMQWEAFLAQQQQEDQEMSSSLFSKDAASGDTNNRTVGDVLRVKRALRIWGQLPHRATYLQELRTAVAELFADPHGNTHPSGASLPDWATVCSRLQSLSQEEKAVLLLLPFPT